jgi:hypothetical protein
MKFVVQCLGTCCCFRECCSQCLAIFWCDSMIFTVEQTSCDEMDFQSQLINIGELKYRVAG